MAANNNSRFANLDAARGLAALLVVVAHVAENWASFDHSSMPYGAALIQWAAQFHIGVFGVYVFFLISGFVIPYSLQVGHPKPVQSFVTKRFFRLMPLYWLSIPFGVVTSFLLWGKEFLPMDWLYNVFMVPNFFNRPFAQGLYWSLQVEVLFYLVVAALLVLRPAAQRLTPVWAVGLVVVLGLLSKRLDNHLEVFKLVSFLLDMVRFILLGWLVREVWVERRLTWASGVLLLGFGYYYLFKKPMDAYHMYNAGADWFAHVIQTTAIVVFLAVLLVQRVPRALVYLGTISYSVYLLHPIVMYSLYRMAGEPWGAPLRDYGVALGLSLTVLGTVGLSHLTWKYVEVPCVRLGRRLGG